MLKDNGTIGALHHFRIRLYAGMFLVLVSIFMTMGVAHANGFGGWDPNTWHKDDEIGSTVRSNKLSFNNTMVEAGVPLIVKGAPVNSVYYWTITGADGDENTFLTEVNSYTPSAADGEKLITVTVEGMEDSLASIYYSTLPVVYINNSTGFYGVGEEYGKASMSMQGNDVFPNSETYYNGEIEIRLRGNSTKWREKRPFNIKLGSKADLLGMGESKQWALLANDIDHTLLRNKLLYDFSGAIGMDTYMKSENVILIFNNQYFGVYQLSERVDIGPERIHIYDWEESAEDVAEGIVKELGHKQELSKEAKKSVTDQVEDALCRDLSWITSPYLFAYDVDGDGEKEVYTITDYTELPAATGGVLLEMDFYAFDGRNPSTMITAYSQPLYFKTPEYAATNSELFHYIQSDIQSFEYALHSTDFIYREGDLKYTALNSSGGTQDKGYEKSEFSAMEYEGKHYSELFDFNSLIESFLVCEFSMNWDSMKNSVFLYKDINGLFHMGPAWDFDWAWGNINMFHIDTWYPTSWHTTEDAFTVEQYYQTLQWNRYLIRDPYFLVRVYEKYKEIRPTVIETMVKTGGTLDTYVEELAKAAEANDEKWGYSYSQYRSVGFDKSIENMKEFILTRLAWLDEQFETLDTLMTSLGYYKPSDKLTVTEVDVNSVEGFAQVKVNIIEEDAAYVSFQVNGTHLYTNEVTEGQAVCLIPNNDLVSEDQIWNVVQVSAMNENKEYIIASEVEGVFSNALSNYAVFYSNIDNESSYDLNKDRNISNKDMNMDSSIKDADSFATENDTATDTATDTAKEVLSSDVHTKDSNRIMVFMVLGMLAIAGAGAFMVLRTRKKRYR